MARQSSKEVTPLGRRQVYEVSERQHRPNKLISTTQQSQVSVRVGFVSHEHAILGAAQVDNVGFCPTLINQICEQGSNDGGRSDCVRGELMRRAAACSLNVLVYHFGS